jgi:serpin B
MKRNSLTLFWVMVAFLFTFNNLHAANENDSFVSNKTTRSISDFAISFTLLECKGRNENLVYCPLSLFSSLSMLWSGAKADTAVEIAKILHINTTQDETLQKISIILKKLHFEDPKHQLSLKIANALWLNQDSFILSQYKYSVEKYFEAKLESIDFSNALLSSSIINEWVSNETEDKIPSILSSSDLSSSTRAVITNAVYFSGSWRNPFLEKNTTNQTFYELGGKEAKAKMMDQTSDLPYFENKSFQIIALPFSQKAYNEATLAMIFVLPKASDDATCSTDILSSFSFLQAFEALETRKVHVVIPKFSMNQKEDLKESLIKLGMPLAFSEKADFSGINGQKDLFISKFIHQCFFLIDEKGANATAASSAILNLKSSGIPEEKPLEFIANRPFIFGLADIKNGTLIFLGIYNQTNE